MGGWLCVYERLCVCEGVRKGVCMDEAVCVCVCVVWCVCVHYVCVCVGVFESVAINFD